MRDDKGPDAKLLCVPAGDPRHANIRDIDDVDEFLMREIDHFFDIYKELEPGKMAETAGFAGVDAAYAELDVSRRRYQSPSCAPVARSAPPGGRLVPDA